MEKVEYKGIRLINRPEIKNLRQLLEKSLEVNNNHNAFRLKDKVNKRQDDIEEGIYIDIKLSTLINDTKYLGSSLLKRGFKGKRIGIFSENRYEWGAVYLSVINGLGVVVPIDKALPKDELKKVITRSEIKAIAISYKSLEMINSLEKEELGNISKILIMDIYVNSLEKEELEKFKENLDKDRYVFMSDLIKEGQEIYLNDKGYDELEINEDEMSALLFTSATTSTSKAVMLSHKNLVTNIYDVTTLFDLSTNDRILSFLPIHHCFECTVGFLSTLFAGTKICYAESLKKLAENIKEYKITAMIAVPVLFEGIYSKIIKQIKKQNKYKGFVLATAVSNTMKKFGFDKTKEIFKDIHSKFGGELRLLVSGAAALNPKVQKGLTEIGINICQGYGLTETSPVISAGYSKYNKVGTVGKVFPSVDIKIDAQEGEKVGEILVKGPSVMLGYYNDEENNKLAFTEDGWLKTGDLGYIDEDGYLCIAGRSKNVIVLNNGKNIFPDESEALLNNIEGVVETMVFGEATGSDKTDVTLSAKIVYDEKFFAGKELEYIHQDIWEQIKQINRMQPTYKYIKNIYLTKEPLIKTTTLKIKRYEEMKKINEEFLKGKESK